MIKKKGGYSTYLKESIDKNLFLLEAGQGKHLNGNVFAMLRCLETDDRWKHIIPCIAVLKENRQDIEQRLKQYGFAKTRILVRNSDAYKRVLATAGYLVTDNSFPTYMVKRKGQVYLNTWHGTPLKQLGRADIANSSSIGNVQKNFLAADYLLFPNKYTRDIMMKDYMMEKVFSGKTIICDYPRNDALFDEKKRVNVRNKHGLEKKKVFAYMPTWRGTGRTADVDRQIKDAEDTIRCIESGLGKDEVLFVNFHFLIGDRLDYSQFSNVKPFPKDYETYDFLCACDVLISDYSSVMIDFAQTGRSVIMYMYDFDEYSRQKGFYFNICSLPFIKAVTVEELEKAIKSSLSENGGEYRLEERFSNPHRGVAAETVLKLMLEGDMGSLEVDDYSRPNDIELLYVGDLNNQINCKLVDKYISELSDEEKSKVVIAFENEVEGSSIEFLKELDKKVDYLRMPGKGTMSRKERIALLLNRSYGLMEGTANTYYKREYERLFKYVNCQQLSLFNTDIFYRIGAISAGKKDCSIRRIPMAFYNRPNEVFYSHPSSLKRVCNRFNHIIAYDSKYGMEILRKNTCEGVHAHLKRIRVKSKDNKVLLLGKVNLRMQAPGMEPERLLKISSKVYGNVLTYPINWYRKNKTLIGEVCRIRARFVLQVEPSEFKKWYSSNLTSICLSDGENSLTVPLMSDRSRISLKKRVHEIKDSGMVCELKEDFRLARLMIRKENVTDSAWQSVKIAFAYLFARITFWNKPVVLFEKNCSGYEESASVVFERLVDDGKKNARFILDKKYDYVERIKPKYRKNIISRFSVSHYYNMFAAGSFLSSESLDHALEKKCANRLFKNHILKGKKNYVFLQHGVMYMVSLDSEQRAFFKKSENGGKQRVVVSSKLEAAHFKDNTNYTDEDIYICGLPKFDKSVRESNADKIVIMTTWRPWEYVNGQSDINITDYYGLLNMIVRSIPEKLKEKMVVLPHPLIKAHVEEKLAENPDDPVWKYYVSCAKYDDVLKKTSLLITDYSSIAYDAFYRGASVIFCWRDKDACMKEYGKSAHLMLTKELAFGDVCMDESELAESVAGSYGKNRPQEYLKNYKKIVEFSDGNNTDRLIEAAAKDGIL